MNDVEIKMKWAKQFENAKRGRKGEKTKLWHGIFEKKKKQCTAI